MSTFIEINEYLIDMSEIKYCEYSPNDNSYGDTFIICLKDNSKIDLSTNRFNNNAYDHYCKNSKGYNTIKKYLIEGEI